MGREIRKVPPDWEHPKDVYGKYKPFYSQDYETALAEWIEGRTKWQQEPEDDRYTWEEWSGEAPNSAYYRPAFEKGADTHFQMYENVSEGTPMSPVFETKEALGEWLADEGFSEHAVAQFLKYEYAPSFMMTVYKDRPPDMYGPGVSAYDAPRPEGE